MMLLNQFNGPLISNSLNIGCHENIRGIFYSDRNEWMDEVQTTTEQQQQMFTRILINLLEDLENFIDTLFSHF